MNSCNQRKITESQIQQSSSHLKNKKSHISTNNSIELGNNYFMAAPDTSKSGGTMSRDFLNEGNFNSNS